MTITLPFSKPKDPAAPHGIQDYRLIRRSYLIILLVVLVGFTFFLTSTIWWKDSGSFSHSLPGTSFSFTKESSINLRRWTYNQTAGILEVELRKENLFYDIAQNYRYRVQAFKGDNTELSVKVAYNDDDMMVLNIPVKRPEHIILNLSLILQAGETETSYSSKLYCDVSQANHDDRLTASANADEYIIRSKENDLQLMELAIQNKNDQIQQLTEKIMEYETAIAKLQGELPTMEPVKQQNANAQIEGANKSISAWREQILSLNEEIKTLEQSVESLKNRLDG